MHVKTCNHCQKVFSTNRWRRKYCCHKCATSHAGIIKWKVDKKTGCWNYIGFKNKYGYGGIARNGIGQNAHRYIYEVLFGFLADDIVVRHKCDNPACINPEHLESGTTAQNVADRVRKNRTAKGESSGKSKLTEKQIIAILKDNKRTQIELADIFHVKQAHISRIKLRQCWSHVKV